MRLHQHSILAIALLSLLATSACSSTKNANPPPPPPIVDDSNAEADSLFQERQEDAKTLFTKDDVNFMTGMISHHAQALVMSNMAPTRGESSEVKTLAARIINAQKDEIATMQEWLRDRNQIVPEVHIDGNKLMVHGAGDHSMHMPGMLTPEQIDELDAAQGVDFDMLFLEYMIQHHKGAVTMVKDLFAMDGTGKDEATFKLASEINVDQLTEIARMEQMYGEMLSKAGSDQ